MWGPGASVGLTRGRVATFHQGLMLRWRCDMNGLEGEGMVVEGGPNKIPPATLRAAIGGTVCGKTVQATVHIVYFNKPN
jgi:hypothetical protein